MQALVGQRNPTGRMESTRLVFRWCFRVSTLTSNVSIKIILLIQHHQLYSHLPDIDKQRSDSQSLKPRYESSQPAVANGFLPDRVYHVLFGS